MGAEDTSARRAAPDDSLGRRLWRARLASGLHLRQVAARAGISHQYLSMLERGECTNPTLRTLEGLRRALPGLTFH